MPIELPKFPDGATSEREMLEGYLRWYRAVVVRKVEGLPLDRAARPIAPSIMSALGVVKHLAWVERNWSRRRVLGEEYPVPWTDADPDADFRIEPGESVESVTEFYRSEAAAADAIWARHALDDAFDGRWGMLSVRWILVHMIEETARHAGHLDLIVEQLDGRTGD